MLGFLFRGLTAEPERGAPLFDRLTAEARRPDWYVAAGAPDTIDGRFAVLATVTAIVLVRLEGDGDAGDRSSVALTERFIHVMESEHRELGLGDPTLGKTVRKLVSMLARRTDLWRKVQSGEVTIDEASRESLFAGEEVAPGALDAASALVRQWRERLAVATLGDLERGLIA